MTSEGASTLIHGHTELVLRRGGHNHRQAHYNHTAQQASQINYFFILPVFHIRYQEKNARKKYFFLSYCLSPASSLFYYFSYLSNSSFSLCFFPPTPFHLSFLLSVFLCFLILASLLSLSVSLRNAEVTTDCTLSPLLRCSRPKNCMHINGGYQWKWSIYPFSCFAFLLWKSRTIPYNVGKNLCCVWLLCRGGKGSSFGKKKFVKFALPLWQTTKLR